MPAVPFVTDKIKEEYLIKKASDKICQGCNFAGCCQFGGVKRKEAIKRNVVKDVQDLFEATFYCDMCTPRKEVSISKFFLPNDLFEKKYLDKMAKLLQDSIVVDGSKVLYELLKWGRLDFN